MKKKFGIAVSILAVIIASFYLFLRVNPPLEIGTLASGNDQKSVVVGIGNKGFQSIKIVDVTVNNNDIPREVKVQISTVSQGFIVTDQYTDKEAEDFTFTDLDDIAIQAGTSATFKKLDDGTATGNDLIYAVNVFDNEAINKVTIKYSYLGIPLKKTVTLDSLAN